jgi:HTH-type transcriptional regulator / antitoxin MqsA
MTIVKCPVCGAAELIRDVRDMSYVYKGERTTIRGVRGEHCPACGEVGLDRDEDIRVSAEMAAFSRKVNAAFVDPGLIVATRRKLGLDQRAAAEIFGGGVNAFSRYETGRAKPPLALIKLLRILDRHPELLNEIRG